MIKNSKHKILLAAASILFILTAIACAFVFMNRESNDTTYASLDKSKIDYDVDFDERNDYYRTNVEELLTAMSEEERNNYYIDVHVEYIGAENIPIENIIFLRSDNLLDGNIKSNQNFIQISPGLYEVITSSLGSVGEMEALTPGKAIDLTIDYNKKRITYTEKDKPTS